LQCQQPLLRIYRGHSGNSRKLGQQPALTPVMAASPTSRQDINECGARSVPISCSNQDIGLAGLIAENLDWHSEDVVPSKQSEGGVKCRREDLTPTEPHQGGGPRELPQRATCARTAIAFRIPSSSDPDGERLHHLDVSVRSRESRARGLRGQFGVSPKTSLIATVTPRRGAGC
jgi:hypothetical protein